MWAAACLVSCATLITSQSQAGALQSDSESSAFTRVYEGALVWTGEGFKKRNLAVRDGRFIDPGKAGAGATRVRLGASYVVPAYANAHAHLTDPTEKRSWSYLKDGVYYVWNPTTVVLGPEAFRFFERKDTFDVATSQGGITEPGGHPESLYVNQLAKWVPSYKGMTLKDFLGNSFHYGRDKAEIDAALDLLVKQKAGFVKSYLLNSERYQIHKDDPKFSSKGLNPANLAYLVASARARGLPVTTHVETVEDLKTAARAGSFSAAHLPGYWGGITEEDFQRRTLTPNDAAMVAKTGMLLVPTYGIAARNFASLAEQGKAEPERQNKVYALQAQNIQLLKKAGASFLVGTDTEGPIFDETEHLVATGAMTTPEALRMVFQTGRRLFPKRRIGCFEPGCEADFLVLSADPSKDIKALRQIVKRVKASEELRAPETPPAI
jgi:imidazolonepropionase-like amidohydrolase